MSRVYHTGNDFVFHTRQEIEQHLLAKVQANSNGQIGTELELFVTGPEGLPLTFDQIEMLLEHIAGQFEGTKQATEKGRIVGLHILQLGDVCLEPGGQIELSSKPCRDLQELETVNRTLRAALDKAVLFFDLRVVGQGHLPSFMEAEDMPRSRFAAYYRHCRHEIGEKAEELIRTMKSVCSLQVNFDPMGDDFHEVYRALLLMDVARAFSRYSERHERLNRTYAPFFPEQVTPVFEALQATSNEELMRHIVDRLLTLKVPFMPDQSSEGFKSCIDIFGSAPTVGALLEKGLLTGEILDNALSLQLTLPNLRRHGVLETRSPDSVNTTEELMQIAGLYRKSAYDPEERRRLLDRFKNVDAALLKEAFIRRGDYSSKEIGDIEIGKGLKLRDLIGEIVLYSKQKPAARKETKFRP